MKKLTALVVAAAATGTLANAQNELSVSATFGWESAYVFRGVELGKETFMPSVDLTYGGFYAGIWAALPVDTKKDDGTEVDFYVGYATAVSDLISLDFGVTYYVYPSDGDAEAFGLDPNTLEFYAGISFEMPLSPALYAFYDIELELLTLEAAIGHSFEVSAEAAIELSAHLGYWDEKDGADQFYAGVGVAYVYNFTENAGLSIGVNYYWSDEKLLGRNGDKSDRLTYGFSFSAGF